MKFPEFIKSMSLIEAEQEEMKVALITLFSQAPFSVLYDGFDVSITKYTEQPTLIFVQNIGTAISKSEVHYTVTINALVANDVIAKVKYQLTLESVKVFGGPTIIDIAFQSRPESVSLTTELDIVLQVKEQLMKEAATKSIISDPVNTLAENPLSIKAAEQQANKEAKEKLTAVHTVAPGERKTLSIDPSENLPRAVVESTVAKDVTVIEPDNPIFDYLATTPLQLDSLKMCLCEVVYEWYQHYYHYNLSLVGDFFDSDTSFECMSVEVKGNVVRFSYPLNETCSFVIDIQQFETQYKDTLITNVVVYIWNKDKETYKTIYRNVSNAYDTAQVTPKALRKLPVLQSIVDAISYIEEGVGESEEVIIPTGFANLNKLLQAGFHRGEFGVVGALNSGTTFPKPTLV